MHPGINHALFSNCGDYVLQITNGHALPCGTLGQLKISFNTDIYKIMGSPESMAIMYLVLVQPKNAR